MHLRIVLLAAVWLCTCSPITVSAQSVTELNDRGWKALKDEDPKRAATLFSEALTMRPNDAVLLLGAGAAAEAQGKHIEAMTRLRRALQVDPRLTPASQLLAEIAYREGQIDLAISTYEAALRHTPGNPQLTERLEELRKDLDVHRTFEERRYDRFRVMFEGRPEESLAQEATEILSAAFWQIGEKLGEYPSDTVLTILYTEKQFRDITRAPEWAGGQYDGRIRIPVAGATREPKLFARVLTHELVHAMVANIAPVGVPAWIHEGLAQYFEGADREAARRRLAARRVVIPLSMLERGFGRMTEAQAQIAYDESLLAVSMIFDRIAFNWPALLHELAESRSSESVLSSFGFPYSDLEAQFPH
jgi:tetratricopeptide (TPR) repeat protein